MKKFLAILLVALMLVSVTACGSSSSSNDVADNGNEGNNETVEVAQGVTDTTVKVANSTAVSGAYAPVGVPFKFGMEAYFAMVNEAGGINGRKIEFIHKDDEFKAENGKAFLEEFINDEKVFAIVGHFGTPVVGATLEDLKEVGIPAVYFATGIGALYNEDATGDNGRNIYPVQPIYNMEGRIMASYAKGYFKAKKVGIIYSTDDAGKDICSGAEQEAKNLGLELVVETIQPGATDATAQVAKMKGCDMVIAAAIQATFPTIIKEMEKQDIMVPVITTYVNVSATLTTNNAEHVQKLMHTESAGIYGLGWVDLSGRDETVVKTTEDWMAWMEKVGATAIDMNAYAMTGWIASSFFCEGLTRVGDKPLTWDNYMDALEEAPIKNPFGGYIDFANGARLGTQEMNLSRMDDTVDGGWVEEQPIQSMEAILAA